MLEPRTMQPVLECRGNLVVVGTGQLRANFIDGNTYATGAVNGDHIADFII